MNIRGFYDEINDCENYIRRKKEKIEELRTSAENITVSLSQDKTFTIGGAKDRVGGIMDKVMDLELEIKGLEAGLEPNYVFMILNFSKLNDTERQVMVDKYCRHMSSCDIASRMGIATRSEKRIVQKSFHKIVKSFKL